MNLNEAKNKYIFYTKVDLEDGDFLKLREPSIAELDTLNKAKEDSKIKEMERLFPVCLVDHSFVVDRCNKDGGNVVEKASSEEVYKMLRDSGTLFIEVITTWMQSIPFKDRLKNKKT
jgi:hypothetical protein